jgi:hypothetical protein
MIYKDLGGQFTVSWNHQEFEVRYDCLSEEIKIGDYYLRLLLEDEDDNIIITNSYVFTIKPLFKNIGIITFMFFFGILTFNLLIDKH